MKCARLRAITITNCTITDPQNQRERTNVKQKLLCSAISAVLLAGTSASVMAQLEEVVVTAQKREQSANDIGMAISALSGDAMRDLNVLDTTDLAVAIPA